MVTEAAVFVRCVLADPWYAWGRAWDFSAVGVTVKFDRYSGGASFEVAFADGSRARVATVSNGTNGVVNVAEELPASIPPAGLSPETRRQITETIRLLNETAARIDATLARLERGG